MNHYKHNKKTVNRKESTTQNKQTKSATNHKINITNKPNHSKTNKWQMTPASRTPKERHRAVPHRQTRQYITTHIPAKYAHL
jgi:hypothetical protein